jgi:hypothetical protein
MQLADRAADADGLHIGVAGDEQIAVPVLEQVGAAALRVGRGQQVEQRVRIEPVLALEQVDGDGGRGFRDHPHGTVDDGIAGIALAREGGIVARRPDGGAGAVQRDEGASRGGFCCGGDTGRRNGRRAEQRSREGAEGHVVALC